MDSITKLLTEVPLANILIAAGITFLLLSVAGNIGGKVSVKSNKQTMAGIIGGVMLSLGLAVYFLAEGFISFQTNNKSTKPVSPIGTASEPSNKENQKTTLYGYYQGNSFVLTALPVTSKNKLNVFKLPVLEKGFYFDTSKLNEVEKLMFNGRASNTSPILDALLITNTLDTPVSLAAIDCDKKPFKPVNPGDGSYRSKMSSADYHYKEYQRTHSLYNCSQAVRYRTLAFCAFTDTNDPRKIKAISQLKAEFAQCQEIIQQQLL